MSGTSDQRPSTAGGVKHGFSGAMYSRIGDDRVQVVMPDGRVGIFDGVGRWIEGELYDVDPEMCVWLSADRIETSHRLSKQQ